MRVSYPIRFASTANLRVRGRARLPHFELDRSIYFVTWRIFDSLPLEIAARLKERWLSVSERLSNSELTPVARSSLLTRYSHEYEEALDRGYGSCVLKNPLAASIVDGALKFFDKDRYDLFAWAVMPNHVHVVFFLERGDQLDRVLHSWKSYTVHRINSVLGRTGKLWQDEYFDRIVRDERELEQTIEYVVNNPAAAGLTNWQFVGAKIRS